MFSAGCADSNKKVDICKCLLEAGDSEFIKLNKDACHEAVSKELGCENWENVNMSQNPKLSAKFDSIARNCQ